MSVDCPCCEKSADRQLQLKNGMWAWEPIENLVERGEVSGSMLCADWDGQFLDLYLHIDGESREPIDVLYDIEAKVDTLDSDNTGDLEPRTNITSKRREFLEFIKEHGPVSTDQIQKHVDYKNHTSILSRMYDAYLLNRSRENGNYVYEITDVGKRALELSYQNPSGHGRDNTSDPWVEHGDLNRMEYYALKTVKETEGHKGSKDMDELFVEMSSSSGNSNTTYAISPRLSNLHKKGYLDRTPSKPYLYWLTEKGRAVFDD